MTELTLGFFDIDESMLVFLVIFGVMGVFSTISIRKGGDFTYKIRKYCMITGGLIGAYSGIYVYVEEGVSLEASFVVSLSLAVTMAFFGYASGCRIAKIRNDYKESGYIRKGL